MGTSVHPDFDVDAADIYRRSQEPRTVDSLLMHLHCASEDLVQEEYRIFILEVEIHHIVAGQFGGCCGLV